MESILFHREASSVTDLSVKCECYGARIGNFKPCEPVFFYFGFIIIIIILFLDGLLARSATINMETQGLIPRRVSATDLPTPLMAPLNHECVGDFVDLGA